MKCPNCNSQVPKENINIQADIAQCQDCEAVFRISESLDDGADGFELHNPPKGAWIRNEMNQIVIGATTRSPIAFFLVPFMIVWSGGSLGGIYGRQLAEGEFDPALSLFGIPFVIGSVIFWTFALMAMWGKVELTLSKYGGRVFTGLGNVGISKTFTWDDVSSVKENQIQMRYPGSQGTAIVLDGKKRISFGTGLRESRRYYLYRALKGIVIKSKRNQHFV